jgi:hypothetical protein
MCGVSWGFFPSAQAAWIVSSEPWFNVKGINALKLRAGFDVTGNDAIDYLAARSYLQSVKFYDQYMGLQLGNVENDGVKWESTARFNVGFDAMLLENRLALSFDWYRAKTRDLLVQKQYQFVTGMGRYWANGGELQNMGLEATLNAKLINDRNFQWELGASIGHYKNEVTALDETLAPVSVYGGEVATMVGQPVGVFWGYKTDGVIASSADIRSPRRMVSLPEGIETVSPRIMQAIRTLSTVESSRKGKSVRPSMSSFTRNSSASTLPSISLWRDSILLSCTWACERTYCRIRETVEDFGDTMLSSPALLKKSIYEILRISVAILPTPWVLA